MLTDHVNSWSQLSCCRHHSYFTYRCYCCSSSSLTGMSTAVSTHSILPDVHNSDTSWEALRMRLVESMTCTFRLIMRCLKCSGDLQPGPRSWACVCTTLRQATWLNIDCLSQARGLPEYGVLELLKGSSQTLLLSGEMIPSSLPSLSNFMATPLKAVLLPALKQVTRLKLNWLLSRREGCQRTRCWSC